MALLADFLPHASCAHALTSVHDFVFSLCFGAWVAQAQLLCFFAYAQDGTVVGLWLWYPVVTHVYGVDNVAHIQGALVLSSAIGWFLVWTHEIAAVRTLPVALVAKSYDDEWILRKFGKGSLSFASASGLVVK